MSTTSTTVRSSTSRKQQTPVDEYAILFVVNGKVDPSYASLDVSCVTQPNKNTGLGGGKSYARVIGTNAYTKSGVLSIADLPSQLAVVGMSGGKVIQLLGKVPAVLSSDHRGSFVSFNGTLDVALPNGVNRVCNIRIRPADKGGYSIWAMCGHFLVSWAKGQAPGNRTASQVLSADALAGIKL